MVGDGGATIRRVLAAVLVAGVTYADAEPLATSTATVRVYNAFGVSARDRAKAQEVASAIFAASGIEIQWRLCSGGISPATVAADPCASPLGDLEVAARFVRSIPSDPEAMTLGVSLIDTERDFGSLASVFPDRVRELAFQARMPYATLLGRALAHEIGHLLLGTTAHSSQGVMRPHWTLGVLRARAPGDWEFSTGDALRLTQALRARAGGGLSARR